MESGESKKAPLSRSEKGVRYIVTAIGVVIVVYYLYRGLFGVGPVYIQRAPLLIATLFLTFLLYPIVKRKRPPLLIAFDALWLIATLVVGGYLLFEGQNMTARQPWLSPVDIGIGWALIVLISEAGRRAIGLPMLILSGAFLAYGFVGPYLPWILQHTGFAADHIVNWTVLSLEGGLWGLPMEVGASVIVIFVMYGAFAQISGLSDLFANLAYWIVNRTRGGGAKLSVISGYLFGMISGSATANVLVTGAFSIPLMKKQGFNPGYAAGNEAVAAAFGQLVPPVMGAVAFVMADFLNVTYWDVVKVAFIPGVLCYFSQYMVADFFAAKHGIGRISGMDKPNLLSDLRHRGPLLLAIVLLVVMIGPMKWSPMRAGSIDILILIALSWLSPKTRMGLRGFLKGCTILARTMLPVISSLAIAGIVIGIFGLTGLGMRFSALLLTIAGNNLLIMLILTMITALIFGLGMPTTPAYLFLAILIAPAMISIGIVPMYAHLFIMYYAILSVITPPEAVAAFAVAPLAGVSPMRAGFWACRICIGGLVLPFMWIFGPMLVGSGSAWEVGLGIIRAALGLVAIAAAVEGYYVRLASWWERIVLGLAAVILIPGTFTYNLIGIGLMAAIGLYQWFTRQAPAEAIRANADGGSNG